MSDMISELYILYASLKSNYFCTQACELAGMHYERLNKIQQAVTLFLQAEKCYNRWGSQMKVQKMKDKAKNLRS
jgi:hypothetical protein